MISSMLSASAWTAIGSPMPRELTFPVFDDMKIGA
jgi:hypothetical protein